MRSAIAFLLAALLAGSAGAQALALPPPPQAGLQQQPGARLPLDLALRDDLGQRVTLRDYFRPGQPVLLVPGYYRCTQLCGLVMHGLLEALQAGGLPRADWRIVGISIDPADTPADARQRRTADLGYADFLAGPAAKPGPLRLDLLVAGAPEVQRFTGAIGLRFQPLPAAAGAPGQFAHPATVIVATPDGQVSRYFNGVQFDPAALRRALVEASGGAVGGISERLALLCAHFDPAIGRFSGAVMLATRIVGALTIAMLAWLALRRRPR